MKNNLKLSVICSSFLFLAACGGVGTEIRDKDSKGRLKDKGCSQSVRASLGNIEDLCSRDLNDEDNRTLCIVEAQELTLSDPNFVCTFGKSSLVDADFIQINIIDKYGSRKTDIENSGIFEEINP